jgi:hypothetical protein
MAERTNLVYVPRSWTTAWWLLLLAIPVELAAVSFGLIGQRSWMIIPGTGFAAVAIQLSIMWREWTAKGGWTASSLVGLIAFSLTLA